MVSNIDPEMRGKLLVSIPAVGIPTPVWAEGCFPVTGTQAGVFSVPEIGAGVWVEFEQGDLDHPIWVGGFYTSADVPAMARAVPPGLSGFTFQTRGQNGITISDTPGPTGGILIKTLDRGGDLRVRRGHRDQQRQGRHDLPARTHRRRQRRRVDGDLRS